MAPVRASGSRKFNISITTSTQVRDSFGAAGKKRNGTSAYQQALDADVLHAGTCVCVVFNSFCATAATGGIPTLILQKSDQCVSVFPAAQRVFGHPGSPGRCRKLQIASLLLGWGGLCSVSSRRQPPGGSWDGWDLKETEKKKKKVKGKKNVFDYSFT